MRKKKVAIVTIVSFNYGNRLQNYALQTAIQKLGITVVTMRRGLVDLTFKSLVHTYLHALRNRTKYDRFAKFNQRVHWSSECLCTETKDKIKIDSYDYFITGSDQVWNVTFPFISDIEFLNFAPKEKSLAYAASFGVSRIADGHYSMVKTGLEGLMGISVREEEGAYLVKDIVGKEVPVVLDPTMLLTADEWTRVENRPDMDLPEKYIFTYFLGKNDLKSLIQKEAKKNNWKIIALDLFDNDVTNENIGPAEFLYLIHHASLVVTDSFHASAFSIIFKRPFVVSERNTEEQNMSSRIDTLLSTFGLKKNRYECEYDLTGLYDESNYDCVDMILNDSRKKSFDYLRNHLR